MATIRGFALDSSLDERPYLGVDGFDSLFKRKNC
jgi:hypothetical protein